MIHIEARATRGPMRTVAMLAAVALGSTGAVAAVGTAPAGAATTTLFSSSTPGVVETAPVVPAGICSVTITAEGGRGGGGGQETGFTEGGAGASVTARVPVAPGDALHVLVAGVGERGDYSVAPPPPDEEYMVAGGAGGIGGGGGGGSGGGGGGASAVWTTSLQPLLVAGGGGGSRSGPGAGGAGGVLGQPGGDGQTQQRDDGTPILGGRAGRGGLADGTGGAGGGPGSLDPAGGGGGGVNAGGAGGVPAVSFWAGGDGGDGNGTVGGGGGGAGRRNLDSGDDGGSPPGSGAPGGTAVERQGGTGVAPGGDGGDAQDGHSGSGGGGGVGFGGGGGAFLGVGGGGGGAGYGAGGGSSGDGGGGGGGGSSFVTPSALSSTSAQSVRPGDGQVTITYDPAADACPPPPDPRPDGRIRVGQSGPLIGNDVYGSSAVDQTGEGSAARGKTATYYVSVQNDAVFADALVLDGTAGDARFNVRYTTGGNVNITPAVVAGTYTTPVLAAGAVQVIKVVVKVTNRAPVGSQQTGALIATSDSDPTFSDTVGFVTSRR